MTDTWADRYEVGDVIGLGAFATVYQARDVRLGTNVALKVLAENHSFDPDLRDRFIAEARRLARITSPHVVAAVDLGETPRGQPFLVMALADRGTLASRVTERSTAPGHHPVDAATTLAVAEVVARALGALHDQRIVHRDLTPRNLLLASSTTAGLLPGPLFDPDERLLLGDLGLSKDLAEASGLTAAVGTAGFTPPEQESGEPLDQRADVWAASALLAWLVTGTPGGDPGWAEAAATRGVPPDLVAVLDGGLADDPDHRPDDTHAWLDAVRTAVQPPPAPAPAPHGSPASTGSGDPAAGTAPDRTRRPPLGVILAAVLVLLIGLGVSVLAADRFRDRDPTTGTVEQVGDDRQRATSDGPGATVSIEGPRQATVDEPVRFEADTGDATTWVWFSPEGATFADVGILEVTASSPGRAVVALVAVDDAGRRSEVQLTLQVTG